MTTDKNDVPKKTTSQKRKIKADTNTKAPTQKSKVSDTDSDADVKKFVRKKSKQVVNSDSNETDCKKQHKSKSDADMKSQKASGVKSLLSHLAKVWQEAQSKEENLEQID